MKIHHSQSSAPEGEREEQPGLRLSVCLSAFLCPDLGLCLSPLPSSIETFNRKHISLCGVPTRNLRLPGKGENFEQLNRGRRRSFPVARAAF